MGSEWRSVRLASCAEFQEGYVNPSQTRDFGYFNGPIKWLRATDLNNGFVYETSRTLTMAGFKSAGTAALLFEPNTIGISKSGTIGRVGILKDFMCGNRAVINVKVRKDQADTRFIFYILIHNHAVLQNLAIGSVQPNLYTSALGSLELELPPIPEQRAIAHILGSLDDNIELNRRMNETLEGMAEALFKSWFVDFDPVIDNAIVAGNPIPEELADRAEVRRAALANGTANREAAKPFPAAFQRTEELGWIPVGWEVGSVLRQAKLLSGGTPKTSEDSYWDGEIKWASAKDVSQCGKAFLTETERTITQEGLDNSSTKVIPRFSTVIVSRGATTGRMAMFGDDIAMNQTCYALRFNTGHHFYGFCHARHFIDSLVQTAHGSVFDTITTKTFESSNVILASSATSGLFENAVQALFEKILTNEHATQSLTKLRDTLLPKLISGELRIPDAEKLADAALA